MGRIIGKTSMSQPEEAEQWILHGIGMLDERQSKPDSATGYLRLGELHADHGQKTKALQNLKKAESMFQDMGMDYWLGKTQEVLARL